MIGQALKRGTLNPETGKTAEATLPVYQSPLTEYLADENFTQPLVTPWAFTRAARGIRATSTRRQSDALMNVSNKPSELNIYQMPTIIVASQPPANQRSAQGNRLPLNFVNPSLAWSPS